MTESRNSENITPEDDVSFEEVTFEAEAEVVDQEFIGGNAAEQHAPLENAPAEFQQPGPVMLRSSVQDGMTPNQMLQVAMEKNYSPEMLQQFMDLKQRYEADIARKAYYKALAAFKLNPPTVLKDKVNDQFDSRYASKASLVTTVSKALSPHGLVATFDIDQITTPGMILVTCILSHELGHSDSVTMQSPPDDSGKKNKIQQIKSTKTYLEIATFESITGTVASDEGDDDGNGTVTPLPGITPDEAKDLAAKLTENKIPTDSFNKWMKKTLKCDSIEELNANGLKQAHKRIDSAIRAKNKAAN